MSRMALQGADDVLKDSHGRALSFWGVEFLTLIQLLILLALDRRGLTQRFGTMPIKGREGIGTNLRLILGLIRHIPIPMMVGV